MHFISAKEYNLLLTLAVLMLSYKEYCECSKVLLVPMQHGSHISQFLHIGEELVKRRHEVYIILGNKVPNQDNIIQSGINILSFQYPDGVASILSKETGDIVGGFVFSGKDYMEYRLISKLALEECGYMLEDNQLMSIINMLKFDISIADNLEEAPCLMLLPNHHGIPVIGVNNPVAVPQWIGLPALPTFVPDAHSRYTDCMTFMERLKNCLSFVLISSSYTISMHRHPDGITDMVFLDKYAPGKYKDMIDLYASAELYITLVDYHLDWPAPTLPYIIQLPGITLRPAQKLNSNLQQVADDAQHGLILVSFGSTSTTLPEIVIQKLLKAFNGLNQTILWKYHNISDHLKGQIPDNVKIFSWIPQNDLLGHPNTKLFITHCGNNGQHESLYHGVPMLGFSLFADQHHNAFRMEAKGYGLSMNIRDFEILALQNTITRILTNKTFYLKTGKVSKILKSRPMLPVEEAAMWVEHVLMFGSDHLKSHSIRMPIYQLYGLDIMIVITCIFFTFLMFVCVLFVCICKTLLKVRCSKKKIH